MNVLKHIASNVDCDCIRRVCEDNLCSLSLEGLDPNQYILIKTDDPKAPLYLGTTRHCDFLFIGRKLDSEQFWVSPVELTTGVRKSSTLIVEQLRAGATIADSLIPLAQDLEFVPIAAGPFKKDKRAQMRRACNMIHFRTFRTFLTAVDCGSKLHEALST